MYQINFNPVRKRWEERMKNLPAETRKAIESGHDGGNLKVLKRTRGKKKDGDIFICTLNGSVYYYGKILQAKIENNPDRWYNECLLICVFREKTREKNLKNFKGDYNDLLVGPCAVTSQYWSMGFFETIGNAPLTEEERDLDYGFWTGEGLWTIGARGEKVCLVPPNTFTKADGSLIDRYPKYIGYGITTLSGIFSEIRTETLIDPSLSE